MPKPNKGESKQDFLQRCTAAVMDQEGKAADQAFAVCNLAWDDSKSQRSALNLSAPLCLTPSNPGESKGSGFMITAYTGAPVERFWGGQLIIATAGIRANAKMPILREHARDRIVGYSIKAWVEGSNFLLQGEFSSKTKDGQEVQALAEEGFPWQASIGVWPSKIKILESDKEKEMVNGQEIVGPAEIWLESYVREVSFCTIGADEETAAIALTGDQKKVPVKIERAGPKNKEEAMPITLQQLEAEAPALLKEIRDKAQAEITLTALLAKEPAEAEKLRAEGQESGVQAERARVMEILEYDGDSAVTLKAIKEGTGFGEMVKLSRQAEKEGKAKTLAEMRKGAPTALGQVPASSGDGETFEAKVQQLMAGQKLSRAKAIIQAARDFPELHADYIARQNPAKK
ncbi:MAG: hypothetical protein WC600_17165 [Desulfobaccales bacterium]